MTIDNDYLKNLSSEGFSYADSHQRYKVQLPLMLSYPAVSGSRDPNDLFKDDAQYLAYPSGVHQTIVVANQQDRYGSLTITSSGVFSVYLQVSEYAVDSNPAFIGTPTVISGEGGSADLIFATYYEDTPLSPNTYAIPITANGTHSIVFPFPITSKAFLVTHSGSSDYSISQLLPRKLVQRYDIEVNSIKAYHVSSTLIDTIALQVADSIVVGPELIGAKSIDGSKIVDGTISGVLIRDGTVTGNKVVAGTISGVLIAAGTITGTNIAATTISGSLLTAGTITFDKIASNTLTAAQIADATITGQKIVSGTISGVLITDNAISASKIQANTITGDKIVANTISGVLITAGTITADNIATRTITADRIVLSGITANLLGPEAVTAAALASGAVISGKLAANSVLANNVTAGIIQGYHVAADTITGAKIAASTISGSLITAGTITADKLSVNQLDAVAANMGNLTVNSGLVVTSGYLSAGKTTIDSGGITVGSFSTGSVSNTDAIQVIGSGSAGNIVGLALYNSSFSTNPSSPLASIRLDGQNALEIDNNNGTGSAAITLNFLAGSTGAVKIFNGNLDIVRSPSTPENIDPGAIRGYDSDGTLLYELSSDWLTLANNAGDVGFQVNASTGATAVSGVLTVTNDIVAGVGSNTMTFDSTTGNATFTGTVTANGFNVYNGGFDSPLYGTGVHQLVYFDGVNVDYRFASYDSATSTYTLLQDVYGTQIMVSFGITVKTNGFRLFAKNYIEVYGVVQNNGGNASGLTAGAGAAGGYFKAATAGGTGLGAATAGSVGAAAVQPTSASFVGALGGRGAAARATAGTFIAVGPISKANFDTITPADADGSRFILHNINSWYNRSLATASTLWQMSPSMGGSSGSKSTTGTGATSGGGGGGGGFILLASPRIYGFPGSVRALGGAGGNATGTGGNFGGGGGGGGGIIAVVTEPSNYDSSLFDVSGGPGGTSIASSIIPVAFADSSTTSTTATSVTIYPVTTFVKNTLYILSIHVQGTAGSLPTVDSVSGAGCEWANMGDLMYSTFGTPTRRLVMFIGKRDANNESLTSFSDDPRIIVKFSNAPTSVRYLIDQIQNTRMSQGEWPAYGSAYNFADSATSISTDLGYTPATNYMQYTVVARSGGTTPVAGTGNTLINNQTVAPLLVSEVALTRQTNSMSWTTAAAAAAITVDLALPDSAETGTQGENGKVLLFPV